MRFLIEKNETPLRKAYHFGDLSYNKKSETSTALTNAGRGTGHFGTGFYMVSYYGEDKIPANYWKRDHWEIYLDSYNLFKPKSNGQGYRLHDAFKLLDELDDIAFKKYNVEDLTYELEDLIDEDGNEGIIEFLKKYIPEILKSDQFVNDMKQGRWGAIEDYAKDVIDTIGQCNDELNAIINKLSSIFNIDKKEIEEILKIVINNNNSDSRGTRFMKYLGYEGVDVTHLNKDNDGLRGLDNFTYGSVIYDLKPNTYKKIK